MNDFDLTPQEQQQVMSALLRGKEMLQAADKKSSRYNTLSAVTQMANNPAAAQAAQTAMKNAQSRYAPEKLGQQGFMLPGSGEFIESPMYTMERASTRAQQRGLQSERLDAQSAAQAERLEAQRQMQTDRLAQQALLTRMLEEGRQGRSALAQSIKAAEDQRKAAEAARGKRMNAGDIIKLADKGAVASAYSTLSDSFKPEFSGTAGIGKAQNLTGKFLGLGYEGQSNWWQNYNEQATRVRNELFGSALTEHEERAFNAANIEPGMKADLIATRLAQQAAAARSAYQKRIKFLKDSGWDTTAFAQEEQLPELPRPAPGSVTPGAPPVRSGRGRPPSMAPKPPPGLVLPPGAVYVGPAQ